MPRLKIIMLTTMLWSSGFGGAIIHPWNATNAIVKAGDSFIVWFDADDGGAVDSVTLRGPYNSVTVSSVTSESGSWIYDDSSGNTYDSRISVPVPADAPEERYDLVVHTSSGEEVSRRAVRVIKEYKKEYTIFHMSDTHICQTGKTDGYPVTMKRITALVDAANIINPDMVFVTGDIVNDTRRADFPDARERWDFYYQGYKEGGRNVKGVYDFDALVFSQPGNHD